MLRYVGKKYPGAFIAPIARQGTRVHIQAVVSLVGGGCYILQAGSWMGLSTAHSLHIDVKDIAEESIKPCRRWNCMATIGFGSMMGQYAMLH